MKQVMAPMFDCLNNSVEFNIIRAVAKMGTRYLLTKESDRSTLLAKDRANAGFRGVTM